MALSTEAIHAEHKRVLKVLQWHSKAKGLESMAHIQRSCLDGALGISMF